MGFHVEINSILRSDDSYRLARGAENEFKRSGSRVYFDDIPIWLCRSDWTALAEIRVISQTRTSTEIEGRFRVLHVCTREEQNHLTIAFRRMFAGGADPYIYLLMNPSDYDKARLDGRWDPVSRAGDGFIHASPADQLTRVANKHYRTFDEVLVVFLRHELLHSEILWEPATTGLYPHVYGPINMDAAERTQSFRKDSSGDFTIAIP